NDTITEDSWNGYNDKLVFTNINPADITLFRNGNDVTIAVAESIPGAGDAESVLLKASLDTNNGQGIESIVFADGTTWGRASMNANVDFVGGTNGDDAITGTSGSDTILAGLGNDTITTGAGNDIIVFKPNFGIDTITDFQAGAGSVDVIEFDNSLFADFEDVLAAAAQVGNDTVITHDAGNTITLKNVVLANLHQDDFRFVA
ncbi:calcium-binding protein, partial [Rhizobium sp. FKY42]|uniref:calcium-binding protein n=1 Tax=Rhizobium sp. FKY42 TaxID=2562310 RepID=UPI002484D202